jgi:hypothetical protein
MHPEKIAFLIRFTRHSNSAIYEQTDHLVSIQVIPNGQFVEKIDLLDAEPDAYHSGAHTCLRFAADNSVRLKWLRRSNHA